MTAVRLDVYGLDVSLSGDWPEVVEALRLDFEWFERGVRDMSRGLTPGHGSNVHGSRIPPDARATVSVERRPPDFDRFGHLDAAFVTPRNVVYQDGPRTVIDYFGRALAVLDRRTSSVVVQGEDESIVHEAAYLFLLSRVGEHLDACGLPRLHALGLSGAGGAVAVLLPSGGGKSTLALQAIGDDQVRILSEDSPLLDRHGILHPFPLRIGINATDADLLPTDRVRTVNRMEFHPKLVLELSAFPGAIDTVPRPLRHIVLGRRSLGQSAQLEPIPRRRVIGALLRECVVGVGIYQGMEFVLQHGMRDTLGRSGIAFDRAACCVAGLRGASAWRLTLGRDHERNWETLRRLLR